MRIKAIFTVLIIALLSLTAGHCQDGQSTYALAIEAVKSKDRDLAFMYFHSLLSSASDLKYREQALFATAEYYFLVNDYSDAVTSFTKFINDYPDSSAIPFALAYLLKIAEKEDKASLAESLKSQIVTSQRLILLFKDSKKSKFQSPFCRKHRVAYYIDKVEFYVDGELFEKISY
jgi:outer membrane protein assembly factor BamD (BamD/ComL family)